VDLRTSLDVLEKQNYLVPSKNLIVHPIAQPLSYPGFHMTHVFM